MGREKRKAILPAGASGAKERHKRVQRAQFDSSAPIPERLVAKPSVPKSKHHTYFEFVENKEKKKKLEVQVQIKMSYPSYCLGKKDSLISGDPQQNAAPRLRVCSHW